MTAREWKPGDKALIEVEVVRSHEDGTAVLIVGPKSELHPEGWRQYALMDDDALRPAPSSGEAATEDVVERAARAFYIATQDDPEWAAMAWDDMGGSEPFEERAKIEIAMRAAFEAAGVVPGRSGGVHVRREGRCSRGRGQS